MNDDKKTIINNSTLIPLGGMIAVLGAFIGIVFYAGRISEKISSHDIRITAVEAKVEQFVTKDDIKELTALVNSLNVAIRNQSKPYVEEAK